MPTSFTRECRSHGHRFAGPQIGGFEGGFERASSSSSSVSSARDRAWGIVAANGRTEKTELSRLADDQPDLGAGDVALGSFSIPIGTTQNPLDWRRNPRDRRCGRFEADVIRPRNPAANPYALAAPHLTVIGGAWATARSRSNDSRPGNSCPDQLERTSRTRRLSSRALKTPPLNNTADGTRAAARVQRACLLTEDPPGAA